MLAGIGEMPYYSICMTRLPGVSFVCVIDGVLLRLA